MTPDPTQTQKAKEIAIASIASYRDHRTTPGGCVQNILANNLMGTFAKASPETLAALPEIVNYIRWEVPDAIVGSPEKMVAHLQGTK